MPDTIRRNEQRLIAGLDILHLPYAGFVAGVETVGAVELSRDDFALFEEFVDQKSSIPVEGRRVATGDDIVRRTVDGYATPFAVKQIEVELALLDEAEPIPLLDGCAVGIMVIGVDKSPDMLNAALFVEYITDCFHLCHKEKPFKIIYQIIIFRKE